MRSTLIATLLLIGTQAVAQDQIVPVLTIGLSAEGICSIEGTALPCDQLARRLSAMHVAPSTQVHFSIDRGAKYESVEAMLVALREVGIKIGYVATQTSQ